jgi:peptide/nickel transport system permease protein
MVYRLLVLGLIKISLFRSSIRLPLDLTLMKIIELLGAVPRLLLILCLAAFLRPSVSMVVLLAMLTYWPAIARLTRAEILKIRTVPYVEAAVALGYHPGRILLRHALPNISVPLLVAIAFGLTNLIALEATLSFLGIGLPPEMPSWGRIISSARSNFAAWWLIVFPGMVITLTVISIQNVNNLILNCLNPK